MNFKNWEEFNCFSSSIKEVISSFNSITSAFKDAKSVILDLNNFDTVNTLNMTLCLN
jgi:hypothetical protein